MHNLLWLKQVFIWMVWFYKLLIFLLHTFSMGVKTGGRLHWEQTVHLHYVQWCYFRLLQHSHSPSVLEIDTGHSYNDGWKREDGCYAKYFVVLKKFGIVFRHTCVDLIQTPPHAHIPLQREGSQNRTIENVWRKNIMNANNVKYYYL